MIGERYATRPSVSLLLPPIVWSLYFALVYGWTAVVCEHAARNAHPAAFGTFLAVIAALAMLTAVPILWTGTAAVRRLRRGDTSFLVRLSALMAALFVAGTVFLTAPALWLVNPCY